jgi:Metallo-peptidase family M12/Calx-beta domain
MDTRISTRLTQRLTEVSRTFDRLARRGTAFLAAAGLLLTTAALGADEALFLEAPSTSGPKPAAQRVTATGARRVRRAALNARLLHDAASPFHKPSPAALRNPASRLPLNLYADRQATAVIERTEYKTADRFTAYGVVEGVPGSHVLFSVDGDALAGTVLIPGQETTQITYAGDGVHQIAELDQELATACGAIPAPGQGATDSNHALPAAIAAGSPPTIVDVMVLYTTAAKTGAGGAAGIQSQIDLAIAEANTCYSNSQIGVQLNLVYRGEVSYSETANASTDLGHLQNPTDGQLDTAQSLRTQYGADLVCLVVETMNNYAGIGYIMSPIASSFSSYGYSVVCRQYLTGAYTFPHELGHNMGCNHDRQNATGSGAFSYSYGNRFDAGGSTYRTVMAYAPGTRIPYFSNPGVSYLGVATGVAQSQASSADNVSTINASAGTVAGFDASTIIDFSTNAVSVAENGTNAVLTLLRTGVITNSSSIKVATVAGTAKAGTDFTAVSTVVTFAANETNKTVTIPIIDNLKIDGTRVFTVSLSSPTNAAVGPDSPLSVTILDNDSAVAFGAATATVVETGTNAVLTLVRTGVTNTTVTVDYATADGTAVAGTDYTNTTGTATFAGGVTSATVTVPLIHNPALTGTRTFKVALSNPSNTLLGAVTNATVSKLDADVQFNFTATGTNVLETAGKATLTVLRLGGTSATNTVDFAIGTNGTAVAGTNYTATNGTLTFVPGVTNLTITLPVLHDGAVAGDKTVPVVLSNAGGTSLGGSLAVGTNDTATVTIQDVDSAFNFSASTNSVAETGGTITVTVVRTGGVVGAATVKYATTNSTAIAGTNYTAATGTLNFAAGVTNKTFTITILNHHMATTNSALFTVGLSAPTGNGQIGNTGVETITITGAGPDLLGDPATKRHSLAISYAKSGIPVLTIKGDVRSKLTIQGSEDLRKWINLTDVPLPTGYAEWADKAAETNRFHYYRIWDPATQSQ